MTDGSS